MKRITGFLTVAALLSLANTALAQQPAQDGTLIVKQRMFSFQGPEGAPPPPLPDGNFVFLASESFGGKS
jgi:hypothetical protein